MPMKSKPSSSLYPFTANSSTHQGSHYMPNNLSHADRSTTNLLSHPAHSSSGPNPVHPTFARGPDPSSLNNSESPFARAPNSSKRYSPPPLGNSASEKFNLSPDPSFFTSVNEPEPDDYLHNPDPKRDRKSDKGGRICTSRGLANLGCLILLCTAIVGLFAGYPLAVYFTKHPISNLNAFNLGGVNSSGQVTAAAGHFSRIDPDTPTDALTFKSLKDGTEMQLVFSDEFEVDNRTFWPGDDPFWEAVDLHYWATNNMEWYYPDAITTQGGALRVSMTRKENHNLHFQSGMMSTWNKFCFTGGTILASVVLPGVNNVLGLWPAVWTMGNLGRAGFGASLEGMWPYTYDSCDVGAMPNQTINGQPRLATIDGDPGAGGALSFLPGQKLSRCTCPGEDHPGPIHAEDGSFVGRAAPEIDVFEAQVDQNTLVGGVSQSGQWAPFNYHYEWFNQSNMEINDPTKSVLNSYTGGALQQATSVVTDTVVSGYQLTGAQFQLYGFEYKPGFDDSYITWISGGVQAWTMEGKGMAADPRVNISARPVPQEPMYILVNLGMSTNFGPVDLQHLTFPAVMSVDYIRVYQPKEDINIGCDPERFPTMDYIQRHIEAYTNPNLTTWVDDYKQPFPRNSLKDGCTGSSSTNSATTGSTAAGTVAGGVTP